MNMIPKILAVTVGVLILAGALIPVLESSTSAELTYINEGVPFAAPDGETHIINVTKENNIIGLTFDGEPMDMAPYETYSIVVGSTGFIRFVPSSGSVSVAALNTVSSYGAPCQITITDNVATVYNKTISDVIAYQSVSGDYVLSSNPCLSNESVIYGAGNTYFNNSSIEGTLNFWQTFAGTIDNIVPDKVVEIPPTTAVEYTSVNVKNSAISTDLYKIESIKFDIVATPETGPSSNLVLNYSYFVVPKVVEYDNPEYLGGAVSIAWVLPVLLIVAMMVLVIKTVKRGE